VIGLVVNPAAGGGRCAKQVAPWIARLRESGLELEVAHTTGPGHATELAQAWSAQGLDAVVSVGGDGTLFEVVNGLFAEQQARSATALGVLPLGTGNSFMRDFGVDSAALAFRALTSGRRSPCDVNRVTHDAGTFHSINLFSVGFTADAGALMNRRFKALGAAGYVLGVVGCLSRLHGPRFPLALDDGPLDDRPCTLLSFSNSRFTGGQMQMAPAADVADGRVDVIRVGQMGRRRLLTCFPRIFQGTHVDMPEVECTTAASVRFELETEVDVMVDGEVLRCRPTRLDVLPSAIEVMA